MQFLVLASRATPSAAPTPTADEREAEFEVIRSLYAAGVVQQIWLRDGGACMIAESASSETLSAQLATLPLVQSGYLQTPTVIALKPYAGFGPRSAAGQP